MMSQIVSSRDVDPDVNHAGVYLSGRFCAHVRPVRSLLNGSSGTDTRKIDEDMSAAPTGYVVRRANLRLGQRLRSPKVVRT